MFIGEFGIVYKAHYYEDQGYPSFVAVKTLKGICIYFNTLFYFYTAHNRSYG